MIDANKKWKLKRRILFIEKLVILLILGICWFKMMFDLPFMITFFKLIVVLSLFVLLQESILIVFEKRNNK